MHYEFLISRSCTHYRFYPKTLTAYRIAIFSLSDFPLLLPQEKAKRSTLNKLKQQSSKFPPLPMKFISEGSKHFHEDCSTLILPAVSIGNVGQLTADLLVSSLGSEKVGYLDDPYVLPCVGNDAYGPVPQGDLALPLEAYDSPSSGVTVIQQRSPVIKGMMLDFAKNMADFIAASGKKHIIILSSLDFGKWQKVDMSSGLQIYYLSSANSNGTDENCVQLGWKKLQEYDPSQKHWKYLSDIAEGNATPEDTISIEDELEEEDYYASLPFAALFSFLKAKGLKVTCLLCYCSEGDNTSDAFQLADATCKLLKPNHPNSGNEGGNWRVPLSWMSVYGPPPDVSIF